MKTIPIFFAFDQNMLLPACVCITSLLENASPDTFYDIFILHSPDSQLQKSKLSQLQRRYQNFRMTFRQVGNDFRNSYVVREITTASYYRLVAPELIPEYEKIIYSDVDVIFRDDLAKFYELDLSDHYFAGVDNCSQLRPEARKHITDHLGLDYRKGYFYAGNIIINSALLLKDNKIDEFRVLGKRAFPQQDMDIMNIACNGRILPLGISFCLTNYLYEMAVTRRKEMEVIYGKEELAYALKSGIVHYNGPKPWRERCLNMDIWWDYYRRSFIFDEDHCLSFWSNPIDKFSLKKQVSTRIRSYLSRLIPNLM